MQRLRFLTICSVVSLLLGGCSSAPQNFNPKTKASSSKQVNISTRENTSRDSTINVDKLTKAIIFGNISTAKLLIGKGADVNKTNKFGSTPLTWAAQNGNTEIIDLLIKKANNLSGFYRWSDINDQTDFRKIRFLDASNCKLVNVPEKFKDLKNLIYLNLSHNQLWLILEGRRISKPKKEKKKSDEVEELQIKGINC